ncbi:MAG: hypothetical protein ACTJHC_08090 [Vagococcus sp.]
MQDLSKEWHLKPIETNYELTQFRPLTIKERWEIYSRLTKPQRDVLDKHRKYLIRSEFIKDSYLKASDWEFVDLKIDSRYPNTHKKENMLYCECGRRLKYQYVVASKKTGKTICLGIQHFQDHLMIPPHVAYEITTKINNVDVALDELLWLKRQNQSFPIGLWEQYAYRLYLNQYASHPKSVNTALGQRIADFKKADMPIYIADFKALEDEVHFLTQRPNEKRKVFLTKENFNEFAEDVTQTIQADALYHHADIWAKQIRHRMINHHEKPKMPDQYFKELDSLLKNLDPDEQEKSQKLISQFANRGMGKWLQPFVYDHLLEQFFMHGYTQSFLKNVHPFMREGLEEFVPMKTTSKKELYHEGISRQIFGDVEKLNVVDQVKVLERVKQDIETKLKLLKKD